MDSKPLVDPELLPLLEQLETGPFSSETLPAIRGRTLPASPGAAVRTSIERLVVAGPANAPDIRLDLYRPADSAAVLPCIYHIHGGGFVAGRLEDEEPKLSALAEELGCCIVSVGYRLAPETPFPGPIEDCYAGLSWVHAHASRLGIDPARIGVMGESAGGGLAASLALLARDRRGPGLAFQHLIYPMLDDRTCVAEPHPFAGEFIWAPASNRFGWSALLGQAPGGESVSPYAAAARAIDLAGLPPTFVSTAALDLFVDENLDYARRLMRAGVPTELHVYPGAFHGFDLVAGPRVADAARGASRAALARFLATAPLAADLR